MSEGEVGGVLKKGMAFGKESVTGQASRTRETMFIRSEAADDGKEDVGICTWLDDVPAIRFTSFRRRVYGFEFSAQRLICSPASCT